MGKWNRTARRMSARLFVLALVALTVGRAELIEPTATLPPSNGLYSLPVICITTVCVVSGTASGFHNTSDVLSGGNELVSTDAIFSAIIDKNDSGVPGATLGSFSTSGTMDITYFGRSITNPLGTFDAQITGFDFAGTFNTHPFEVEQNPTTASTGQTTILPDFPFGPSYQVSSFFDVFAEVSLNGGPFVAGPMRVATLSAAPEPRYGALAAVLLAALAGTASRRRRISKTPPSVTR